MLYDLALSYRDFGAEIATLSNWHTTATGAEPRSVLELACGPARHGLEFARRGAEVVGIDRSGAMCRYAAELSIGLPNMSIEEADMSAFLLDASFDLAILMLNSIDHVTHPEALHGLFISISGHLDPGGTFIIEADRESEEVGSAEWSKTGAAGDVTVRWSWTDAHERAEMTGRLDGRDVAIDEIMPMRHWRASEIVEAARASGMEVFGHFGSFGEDTAPAIERSEKLEADTDLQCCFVFRTGAA